MNKFRAPLYRPRYRHWSATIVLLLLGGGLLLVLQLWHPVAASSVNAVDDTPSATSTVVTASATRTATRTRTPTNTPTALPTPGCSDEWAEWPNPSGERLTNTIYGMAAASPDEVWAVGDRGDYYHVNLSVMIERWDGTVWSQMPVSTTSSLRAVAVAGPDDVWAVGNTSDAPLQTLTMHWNGVAWSTIASANVPTVTNNLYAVAAAAPDDVWAVGAAGSNPLALRWDGAQWNIVPTPAVDWGVLRGVAVAGPNDVWAVGSAGYSSWETLILHWDGTTWSRVASPSPGIYTNGLEAVSVVAPNNIWAVGWSGDDPYTYSYTGTILHWDGSQWTVVAISGPSGPAMVGRYQLFGLSMASSTEGWAVGWGWEQGVNVQQNALVRWDGTSWTLVDGPNPNWYLNQLFAVASVAPGEAWAAGTLRRDSTEYYDPQILRIGPPCATLTPAPATSTAEPTGTVVPTGTLEPTDTPVAPTDTPLAATDTAVPLTNTPLSTDTAVAATPTEPPTATPENTPETCPVHFSDVQPGDTFAAPIMCLACAGQMSGYADGTFRPYNPVTRGQLAKIVANAAGFNEAVTGDQMFEDVVPGSAFYVDIERLAARGLISGYPCGGPVEPCRVANRPYFRPGATATRGQIAKIVSNAAHMNDVPGGQMFADVPPEQPFYVWLERLAMHHMLSGYQCGGPREPCGPDNLPYLRPYNNATRGQVAKIVANTFLPNGETP